MFSVHKFLCVPFSRTVFQSAKSRNILRFKPALNILTKILKGALQNFELFRGDRLKFLKFFSFFKGGGAL